MGKLYYVYILRCSDSTLYTGITTDPARRLEEHNSCTGARYTRARLPVEMVFAEQAEGRSEASKREVEIKVMSREEKLRMIDCPGNLIGEILWTQESTNG